METRALVVVAWRRVRASQTRGFFGIDERKEAKTKKKNQKQKRKKGIAFPVVSLPTFLASLQPFHVAAVLPPFFPLSAPGVSFPFLRPASGARCCCCRHIPAAFGFFSSGPRSVGRCLFFSAFLSSQLVVCFAVDRSPFFRSRASLSFAAPKRVVPTNCSLACLRPLASCGYNLYRLSSKIQSTSSRCTRSLDLNHFCRSSCCSLFVSTWLVARR